MSGQWPPLKIPKLVQQDSGQKFGWLGDMTSE